MKVYLNLVFTLLLSSAIQVVFGECDITFSDLVIEQSTSCPDSKNSFDYNGSINVTVSGNSGPFYYRWDNLSTSKFVKYSDKPSLENVSGGDYKLTVVSLFSNCKVSKMFLVHGIFHNADTDKACPTSAYPPEVTGVTVYGSGRQSLIDVGFSNGSDSGSLDAKFREKGSTTAEGRIWQDVPKPELTSNTPYEIKYGTEYEFIVVSADFIGNSSKVGHISKPFSYTHVRTSTKTKQAIEDNFIIGPLPADDYLSITPLTNLKIQSIEILSLNGQVERSRIVEFDSTTSLDVSNLPNGIYLLKINSESETFVKKIIAAN